jgi:hypothetical protein
MKCELVEVEIDSGKIICQKIVPVANTCTPSNILNALRFGPQPFRDAFGALTGNSNEEKLMSLIFKQGSEPSSVVKGRKLFEEKLGVLSEDIPEYFNSLLPNRTDHLTLRCFDLVKNEPHPNHLARIHKMLVSSLQKGVPIITTIRAFAARKQKDNRFQWEGIAQHSILIVSLPEKISDQSQGFMFRFIQPSNGKLCEGYIYTESIREFQAIKATCCYTYEEDTHEFKPMEGSYSDSEWIANGFLHLVSPSLSLNTGREPWYARTFLALTCGLGRF